MNESATGFNERPSTSSAFLRGAGSGAFSGALMMGILAVVSLPFHAAVTVPAALITITATTLFGGIMAGKRALFSAPSARNFSTDAVAVPVRSAGMATAPVVSFDGAEDLPAKNWAASTGRSDASQSRIQQILADGSLSDHDRASAILADRDASVTTRAAR